MSKTLRGTVEFKDLEGGIYQLVDEHGVRTTLLGARKELKGALGKKVEIQAEPGAGFGIAMAGPEVRVLALKQL